MHIWNKVLGSVLKSTMHSSKCLCRVNNEGYILPLVHEVIQCGSSFKGHLIIYSVAGFSGERKLSRIATETQYVLPQNNQIYNMKAKVGKKDI